MHDTTDTKIQFIRLLRVDFVNQPARARRTNEPKWSTTFSKVPFSAFFRVPSSDISQSKNPGTRGTIVVKSLSPELFQSSLKALQSIL